MKKTFTLLSLSLLLFIGASAQKRNTIYTLYYHEKGSYFYPIGMTLSNDTLYISTGGLANVVAIKKEGDTTIWSTILLRPFRQPDVDHVKKDTTKKDSLKEVPNQKTDPKVTETKGKRYGG